MSKKLAEYILLLLSITVLAVSVAVMSISGTVYSTGDFADLETQVLNGQSETVQLQSDTVPWGVSRIGVEGIQRQNKGDGVKVAIIDTGIDLDHPDLKVAGNVTFVSGTGNGDDDNGHGTLVAGIIAALDNSLGYVGVAPQVELYAVKVLDKRGQGTLNSVVQGIRWAIENDMQVINLSFGDVTEMSYAVEKALNDACNAGIIIVAGAGNAGNSEGKGNNVWYPARYESVIAVGAADKKDTRYMASSTGDALELIAPGVVIYSTARGGGYSYLSGTSAAAPHVVGVAALLIATGMNNSEDVRHCLQNTAVDLGEPGCDSQYGYGMVDAELALKHASRELNKVTTVTHSWEETEAGMEWYAERNYQWMFN